MATVSARRRRVFIPVSKIWAARSDSWSSGALQSGVAHARREDLARRQHGPGRAAHAAAVRAVPDGQAERQLRDGDLEVAVRLARRRRARSQELELRDVAAGEAPAVRVQLPDLAAPRPGGPVLAARDQRLLSVGADVPEAS